MTTATPAQKREALRNYYQQGIKPVDGRQPIPEDLALLMVQELKDNNVPVDALIGVHDTFLTLTLTLIEYGFTNIVLMENIHKNLTSLQEKYYNTIEKGCDKIGVTYYVPPMNNYNRCDMDFDVVIGNPPFQSNDGNGDLSGSGTGALWWKIAETNVGLLKDNGIISLITPTNILNGGDTYTKLILGGKRDSDGVRIKVAALDGFDPYPVGYCYIKEENIPDVLTPLFESNVFRECREGLIGIFHALVFDSSKNQLRAPYLTKIDTTLGFNDAVQVGDLMERATHER